MLPERSSAARVRRRSPRSPVGCRTNAGLGGWTPPL